MEVHQPLCTNGNLTIYPRKINVCEGNLYLLKLVIGLNSEHFISRDYKLFNFSKLKYKIPSSELYRFYTILVIEPNVFV